jgi:hypothetical protein
MVLNIWSLLRSNWRVIALLAVGGFLIWSLWSAMAEYRGSLNDARAAGIEQGTNAERAIWQAATAKAERAARQIERDRADAANRALESFRAEQIRVRVIERKIIRKVKVYAESPAGSVVAFDPVGVRDALRPAYNLATGQQPAVDSDTQQ